MTELPAPPPLAPPGRLNLPVVFLAAFIGLLAGGAFFFLGATGAAAAASNLGISPREGAQGYFAVAVGLLAGFFALLAGILLVFRWREVPRSRFLPGLFAALGVLLATGAATFGIWYSTQPHQLGLNGPKPRLVFELERTEALSKDALAKATAELDTKENVTEANWNEIAPRTDDRIRRGYLELYFRTSNRMFVVKLPNGEARLFRLHLSANPTGASDRAWSPWQPVDFLDKPSQTQPVAAGKESDLHLRYKVESPEE